MKYIISIITAILVSGCANTGLTAEQMAAMAGSSSSMCIHGPGWNGSVVDIHYASFGGKSVGTAGGGGKAVCGGSVAEFTNEGRLVTVPVTVPVTIVPVPAPRPTP